MPPTQKKETPKVQNIKEVIADDEPKMLGMRWFFDPRPVNQLQKDQEVSTELLAAELLTRAGILEKHEKLIPGIAKAIEDVYCR